MLVTIDGGEDRLPMNAQLVVSEPLELHWSKHTWVEVPSGSIGIIRAGQSPQFTPLNLHL